MPIRDLFKVQKFQIITDVFGEEYYLRRSEIDKNFKVEVCFGLPVYSTVGAPKIIVTQELKDLILNTLTIPAADFNDVLGKGSLIRLRRLLRNNPYQSYHQWANSTPVNKPDLITFNDVRDNSELIKDYFGREYVILSARQTRAGLVFPTGILKKYRFYPHETRDIFPFYEQTISFQRSELGYSVYSDRTAFLVRHVQEILDSIAVEFSSQFGEAIAKKSVISSVKSNAKFILTRIKEQTAPDLIALLEKFWKTPSDDARKAIDAVFRVDRSIQLRRAFDLLKTGKLI